MVIERKKMWLTFSIRYRMNKPAVGKCEEVLGGRERA